MAKADEKVIRQYALRLDRFEVLLPKGAEVLSVSQLHDRPFLIALTDALLTNQEQRVFHLIDVGRVIPQAGNLRFIGSIFAMQKVFCAFEEIVSSAT